MGQDGEPRRRDIIATAHTSAIAPIDNAGERAADRSDLRLAGHALPFENFIALALLRELRPIGVVVAVEFHLNLMLLIKQQGKSRFERIARGSVGRNGMRGKRVLCRGTFRKNVLGKGHGKPPVL